MAAQVEAANNARAEANAAENPAGSGILVASNLEQPELPVVEERALTGAAGAD